MSSSLFSFVYIFFFVCKNINLVTRIFFQILEPTHMSTKGQMDSAISTITIKIDGIIYWKITSQQISQETKLCTPGDTELVRHFITEFHYDADGKATFPNWFVHFEDLFIVHWKEQAEDWKFRLLLGKLDLSEHNQYSNYILPKHPRDYNFAKMVEILKQIFRECTSLFNICFNYLNFTKCDTVGLTYPSTTNKECEWFKISFITDTQCKCLISVRG